MPVADWERTSAATFRGKARELLEDGEREVRNYLAEHGEHGDMSDDPERSPDEPQPPVPGQTELPPDHSGPADPSEPGEQDDEKSGADFGNDPAEPQPA